MTASAISTPTSSCASTVDAPRWGVHTTSGRWVRGWSAGGGSFSKTSSAAAATMPASSARTRAPSSITPPRATLTTRAPRFILANRASLNRPFVSGVIGMCSEKKSAVASASSSDTSLTPSAAAFASDAYGSYATTLNPRPRPRRPTSDPTLPKPMTASVLPTIDTPTYLDRSHRPALMDASAWATLRATEQMRAMPCSAAATVLAVGALTTRQPAAVAAPRSTLSTPTPARPTTLRRPADASNTSLVTWVADRMISASDAFTFSFSCSGVRPRATSTVANFSSRAMPAWRGGGAVGGGLRARAPRLRPPRPLTHRGRPAFPRPGW